MAEKNRIKTEYRILDVSIYEDEECFADAYRLLSKDRKEKIEAVKSQKDRLLSLGAGILLDGALQSFGLDPKNTRITVSQYGKPQLADHPDLYFNLSHSGSMAMCAVSDCPVGCDIQIMSERRVSVASRLFSAEEAKIYEGLDLDSRRGFFFRVWALKESAAKADGRGLSFPMKAITVMRSEAYCEEEIVFEKKRFRLAEVPAPEGYRAAVCEIV